MKTNIIGRQLTVRESLRTLIEKKLSKLDKYFKDDAEAFVTLSKKRNVECLELTINSSGTIFRSEVDGPTFQHAIDDALDAIERQIRKNKTRLEKRLRDGAFIKEKADAAAAWKTAEDVEEEGEFEIRRKEFTLKPMTAEDAILQMNLLGHEFFVYVDAETEKVNVVYKRKDGKYGLIETR